MGYKLIPPGRRRNNATWIVRGTVRGKLGRRRFEARSDATTKAAAEEWAIGFVAGLQRQLGGGPSEEVTFEEAALAYIDFKNPRRDDKRFIDRLIAWFDTREDHGLVKAIVGADLIAAAHALLPNTSNAHKNRSIITNASAILHYAQEQGWAPERRFRRLEVSRKSNRRPVSAETMALLLANTSGAEHLFLSMLYEIGPRVTDLCRLHEDDCHLQAGTIMLGSSKTDDRGEIELSPELVALLANRLAEPFRRHGKVFPWRDRHQVYDWLVPLRERLGVHYTPHLSRHAMATDLRGLGMDRKDVAERGLWRDERSVDRYDHHRAAAVPGRSIGTLAKKA
jgi:site-specific recombinase XerD